MYRFDFSAHPTLLFLNPTGRFLSGWKRHWVKIVQMECQKLRLQCIQKMICVSACIKCRACACACVCAFVSAWHTAQKLCLSTSISTCRFYVFIKSTFLAVMYYLKYDPLENIYLLVYIVMPSKWSHLFYFSGCSVLVCVTREIRFFPPV